MTWIKQHTCNVPPVGDAQFGDLWTCDECGAVYAVSKARDKMVFVPPFLVPIQRAITRGFAGWRMKVIDVKTAELPHECKPPTGKDEIVALGGSGWKCGECGRYWWSYD